MAISDKYFISYNKFDKEWALWVSDVMDDYEIPNFIQAKHILAGHNFIQKMDEATRECNKLIAILSSNYLASSFTQPEWQYYFAKDPTSKERLILPFKVETINPEGFWLTIVHVDLTSLNEEEARNEILKALMPEKAELRKSKFPGIKSDQIRKDKITIKKDPLTENYILHILKNTEKSCVDYTFKNPAGKITRLSDIVVFSVLETILKRYYLESDNSARDNLLLTIKELLIPKELITVLSKVEKLVGFIDDKLLDIPWEKILCIENKIEKGNSGCVSFNRNFLVSIYHDIKGNLTNNILFLSNKETERVNYKEGTIDRFIKDPFNLRSVITNEFSEILEIIFTNDYQCIHLSGFGAFCNDLNPGLLLSDNMFLTSREFEQMTIPPALIIFEYYGNPFEDLPEEYAINKRELLVYFNKFSQSLINSGVKSVLITYSFHYTNLNKRFLQRFYECYTKGMLLNDCVYEARKTVYDKEGRDSQAFQTYFFGEPNISAKLLQ